MKLLALLATICLAMFMAGCNPLEDDDSTSIEPESTATREAAPTLPPMQIVTRTPVDPLQIPATPSGTPESVEVPSTYVVQEGDSLYSIAIRFGLELAQIVAVNGLSDPNDISVGQELILPAPEEE